MDYLKRYAATTRHKVDMELADRFDWQMRKDGEKPIKQQMATARRAATTMTTLLRDFTHLPDSQAQQLQQSAKTLRTLADSLESLARFAKGYHAFYKAELQREHDARLDKLASERWGNNTVAVEFEWALIAELQTLDGRRALALWMHSQGRHTDTPAENFHSPFPSWTLLGLNKKREAANFLDQAIQRESRHTTIGFGSRHCHVGTIDYEQYLAARKAAAAQAQNLVHKLTHQATH
ncbi:hypothetical protein N5J23_04885 [Comamonas aquatica]|uniref:Uncharacterized protein n=1 Tax=Comamonas aquatica TaxID=225991 RepID=A0AA42W260_9BURK|nr:hypothetical protein [Comamonas aquatica]MDH1429123.1 hypothetical protein [Comamonas aquatica]MDH1605000.1 hypothetical protein [Comamonas aquatica]MDH1616024.1 hypothetical protein [Comamonas aquatica]MDH2004889.1 hypothetical protein [Comamonas aquatica]